ncbi:hypothetical protein BD324DRAFT_631396 [Kockovaella imperatae]|uniref:Small ribosomal subunit protein uS13m n=1 Tax=Kockovaella imperatae TaxID=4999 RepID=A0A1Y1UCF1_9TREE|nr:hypothetical protein BD324DRAFT_631396 [Kockovaella imperatae]ORX35723.1 hypothetical protein BD324DRAFT_631396 [Kockovaella imperatae]
MHLLGRNLLDHKPVRIALTNFFGIGHSLAPRILARLQIHHTCKVSELTEPQITALSAYLSSPVSSTHPDPTPLAVPALPPRCQTLRRIELPQVQTAPKPIRRDVLDDLKIETDLKRSMLGDIQRLREIGTYRGRRHAAGLPVRGQSTHAAGRTAKKLNRLDRRFN